MKLRSALIPLTLALLLSTAAAYSQTGTDIGGHRPFDLPCPPVESGAEGVQFGHRERIPVPVFCHLDRGRKGSERRDLWVG